MSNLLRKEWLLLGKSKPFFLVLLYSAVSGLLNGWILTAAYGAQGPMGAPAVWTDTVEFSYLAFEAVFLSLYIGRGFSSGGIAADVRAGYSRCDVLLSRALLGLPACAVLWAAYSVPALLGYALSGHAAEFSPALAGQLALGVLVSMVCVMAMMSVCLLLAFLIRSTAGSLALNVFLSIELTQIPLLLRIFGLEETSGAAMSLYRGTILYRASVPFVLQTQGEVALTLLLAVATIAALLLVTLAFFQNTSLDC